MGSSAMRYSTFVSTEVITSANLTKPDTSAHKVRAQRIGW